MILDLIILAIAVTFLVIGIVRGIAKTLLNLLSVFVSGFLASVFSKMIAGWIYTQFISKTVTESVTDAVSNSAKSIDLISQEAIDNVPDFFKGIFSTFGIVPETVSGSASQAAAGSSDIISKTVDDTLYPVITSVLSAILIVFLFFIFLLICKLISSKLVHFFDLPILNSLNRILGGALGLCEGAGIAFVLILVCRIIVPLSSEPLITPEMIDASTIFRAVYYSDVVNNIVLIFNPGSEIVQNIVPTAESSAAAVE